MDIKKTYQEKVEAHLAEWGKYLELFKAKAKTKIADAKEMLAEEMEVLHQKYEAFQVKWAEAKSTQADKWEGMKAGLEKKFEELKAAFQKYKKPQDSSEDNTTKPK